MRDKGESALRGVMSLADEVQQVGEAIDMPFIAVSADISCPEPMIGTDGKALAETRFRWVVPEVRYWQERDFALRSPYCRAIRASAEPFFIAGDRAATWRPSRALDAINAAGPIASTGVGAAIVAPAHLPRGLIGAIVWASPDPDFPVETVFEAQADRLHSLALRFIGSYHDARGMQNDVPASLTRREVQCLKWAAAGKTDADIARIVDIAVPTVRFHITNAWKKLQVVGRSQAIYRATTLGYLGGERGETRQ